MIYTIDIYLDDIYVKSVTVSGNNSDEAIDKVYENIHVQCDITEER